MQQRVQRPRVNRQQRLLTREQPLPHRIHREPHRRLRRPLRDPRLQQVQLALFDRELDVLHITVLTL